MMNFQDKLQTNAPSIRYEGDIRPEQAQLRQQQAQAMQQMQQQAMMQQPQGIMQAQGRMPAGRMPAAYGGIMGMDGRKQYGIGSWWQEKIMDPIKNNPIVSAAAAALAYDQFGILDYRVVESRYGAKFYLEIIGGRDLFRITR